MKKSAFLFLFLLLGIKASYATRPPDDILVIGKDSIEIHAHPFVNLDSGTLGRLDHWLDHYRSDLKKFYFFGGYRRIWQIIDDKMYLVGLKDFKHSDDILRESFCDKYKDGKVLADWFTETLCVPYGRLLRMDLFYNCVYEREEMYELVKGKVMGQTVVINYNSVPNGIPRRDRNAVKDTLLKLFRQYDLKKLRASGCLPAGFEICVNDKGKVEEVSFLSFAKKKSAGDYTCIQEIRQKLADLQFDIIKWHGRPDYELCDLGLFYDEEKDELILL